MCPDHQILSIYLDQELPSPWKEKLESHFADCPACRARLEEFRQVSVLLNPPGSRDAALPDEALRERVWRNITVPHEGADIPVAAIRHPREYRSRIWRRSVQVPLPVAAAAAALLVFVLTLVFINRPAENAPSHDMIAGTAFDVPEILPVSGISDMNGVLQYLDREEQGDIMIIRLPESRNFMSSGKPVIIKAADYSRRSPAR
jgi:hypothetical protein